MLDTSIYPGSSETPKEGEKEEMTDDLIIRKLVITLIVVAFMFVPLLIIAPASAQDTGVYAEKICSCVFSEDSHTLVGFTYPIYADEPYPGGQLQYAQDITDVIESGNGAYDESGVFHVW